MTPPSGGGVARPEDGRDQVLRPLAVEGERPNHGQVAPGVVVAVEEGELLLAVGRVVRGVQVDGDALDPLVGQAGLVVGDDHVGESLGEPVQVPGPDAVLEAGEGGLGGQRQPRDGVAPHEELVDRVGLEGRRVVGIRVAAGQAEAALPDEGVLFPAWRHSGMQAASRAVRSSASSIALSRTAPPSELWWSVSKVATRGLAKSVGNSTVCTACSGTRVPPL